MREGEREGERERGCGTRDILCAGESGERDAFPQRATPNPIEAGFAWKQEGAVNSSGYTLLFK